MILTLLRRKMEKIIMKKELLINKISFTKYYDKTKTHKQCNVPNSEMIVLCSRIFTSHILNKVSLQKDLPNCTYSMGKQYRKSSNDTANSDR